MNARQGYTTVGVAFDEEDEFGVAQANMEDHIWSSSGHGGGYFSSGYVYSNVNGMHKQTIPDLLNVVQENLINYNIPSGPKRSGAQSTCLTNEEHVLHFNTRQGHARNDFDDPAYFTNAFSTLFWHGSGSHLQQHNCPISIEEWAKWLCRYHS